MAEQRREASFPEQVNEAIATATQMANSTAKVASETVTPTALKFVEQTTENVGKFVSPIVDNPVVKFAAKLPGLNVLAAALGNVDVEKAQQEVDKLRQSYPYETSAQIAHRIIVDTSLKAAGIGLATNFIPPLALTLFAVDIAAITALQAEMIYRIAAAYGYSLKEPTRRGEVLGIFGLSVGGSGVLKVGLGIVELLPVVGAVIGASSDAALLYALGYAACQFYEAKRSSVPQAA